MFAPNFIDVIVPEIVPGDAKSCHAFLSCVIMTTTISEESRHMFCRHRIQQEKGSSGLTFNPEGGESEVASPSPRTLRGGRGVRAIQGYFQRRELA